MAERATTGSGDTSSAAADANASEATHFAVKKEANTHLHSHGNAQVGTRTIASMKRKERWTSAILQRTSHHL